MKHYHLMGIGGIGQSGLARILKHDGQRVSGCDQKLTGLTRELEYEGIRVVEGHNPEHLSDVDVLVASTGIPESNPELARARLLGIPVRRRIEVVADILSRGFSLGITGSHGKSSTSSMLTSIFLPTDPTVLLGAELSLIGGNAKPGKGQFRIAEVDESDPLFQFLALDVAVITNLEADHVSPDGKPRPNYHTSYKALQEAIQSFAERANTVIYNAAKRWELLEQLTRNTNRIGFGIGVGECQANNLELRPFGSQFDLFWHGENLGGITLQVPGEHNVENALAAAAAALTAGLSFEDVQAGLARYAGAGRRFEKVGEMNGAIIVDDYAHNGTKLFALLKAAKNTGLKVRAVFQPHRYGRSEQEWKLYAEALEQADEIFVLDVYASGEKPIHLTSKQIVDNIVDHLHQTGHPAHHTGWDETLQQLRHTAQNGDLILTIGAGSVSQMGRMLVEKEKA